MIERPVRQTLSTGSPRLYAAAMGGLWTDLELTLARLDVLAADQERLLEDRNCLPGLQYDLHRAAELVRGLTPPAGSAAVHDEVAQALAEARELTAEIAEALACGGTEAAAPLVWEWRGVLFRVRFARHRLERPRLQPAPVEQPAPAGTKGQQLFAASAVAVGSVLVLVAALLGLWLLVAIMLTGTVAGSILLRP
jgi:hypothetical protein